MKIEINNLHPRRDTQGRILDAHGGPLFNRFDDLFYNYGVGYGETDGYSKAIDFNCYSSKDLLNWKFRGSIWDGTQRKGLYFRPHVIRHAASGKYILWFLHYENFWRPGPEKPGPNICIKGTATADRPEGPFTPNEYGVQLSCELSGDHDLFVDDDGTAYIAHSHHDFSAKKGKATIRIERLNDDYLSSSMEHVVLDSEGTPCEAPALFKRGDTYYCLFDEWTDRLKWGSGARVYTAPHPLGPWTYRGNPNRNEKGEFRVWAQQNTVALIETLDGTVYLWAGDRWRSSEFLGTDLQYWHRLEFNEDGSIRPFEFTDRWSLDIEI